MKLLPLSLTLSTAVAQKNFGWEYNYKEQGADWPNLKSENGEENNCGGNTQSPVNLLQPIGSYGWAYGETIPKANDKFSKTFDDLKKLISVSW